MKFRELKEKFQNKFTIRMIAGILCVALAGGSFAVSQPQVQRLEAAKKSAGASSSGKGKAQGETKSDSEKGLSGRLMSALSEGMESEEKLDGKEETVYLITDASGKVNQTIVSSWLKNGSNRAEIKDVSSLTDIENVKGEETFIQDGDQITWQAGGEDIFYRGTTSKELPITERLTYYLDGVEVKPEELAGKSGKVTIRFDYENHAKAKVKINGKKEDIYVPFTVVSGMVLGDGFRNVHVNNGKILSDGNKVTVVGLAMPGLKESLDIDEKDFDGDADFLDYVEVTADVENFSLEMTATAAVAGLMSDSSLSQKMDLSELDKRVDEVTDAMGQLKNGSGELADGLDTLKDSMGSFKDGISSLQDGVNAYTDGASRLAGGIQSLSDSSGSLESGVNALNSSAKTINDGVQQLAAALHTQMTDQEKAAAQQQVDQAVETQFQKGSQAYNMVYNGAVSNFTNTLTAEAAVNSVQAGIQAGMQAQGLTSEGVVAALAEYYAQNGFTDASGKTYSAQACQANVPGTETTFAAYFANAVLNGGLSSALAGGITDGIAKQGSAAVGEAVVGACKMAAKQAGGTAAVTGAESAKQQAAAAIETVGASGYSLVSGTQALCTGTQQLADSIPALKDGIGTLLNGANELAGKNDALKNGVLKLADGSEQISDGVGKLKDGAHELEDGLVEFDDKAIAKLVETYHGDVKALAERMKKIVKAGEDYGTFCGAKEGTSATTKFIFRTDAVKVLEE